jgi:hypothetical protein
VAAVGRQPTLSARAEPVRRRRTASQWSADWDADDQGENVNDDQGENVNDDQGENEDADDQGDNDQGEQD